MARFPGSSDFDAVAAANELDELLGEPQQRSADGDAQYIATLEAEVAELNALLATKDAELRRANARAEQAHGEIEATVKRRELASTKELEQRTRRLLESFLPVVDDLDRGIGAARRHAESADVVAGLELVRRSLLTRLGQFGVTHAPSRGQVFDPRRHDAIAVVPVTDPAQDGRVVDVVREGYLIGDETLRPAGVAVGKRSRS
ncbi:MAG: nucleotide exchange factor GrpE [Kofleriaceae bacterium]